MTRMPEKPLISVIIPTYNRAEIINIPLQSVFNQSYKNLEIIIVDDRSTDNTETVINNINDPRIRYIRHSVNQGGAAARNTGIDTATGKYIAFLDSDDAWVSDKLELQLAQIQKYPNPERVVSYTQVFFSHSGITENTYHTFDKKFFLPKRGKEPNETVSDYLFCNKGKTLTSTLMMHHSLAINTRFRDSLRKHQDWDFCLRLEARGAIFSFIEQPLTIWNGDSSFEHVGRILDYRLSENFIRECQTYLSPKATTVLLLDKVIPSLIKNKQRKLYSQKLLLNAFYQRLVSFKKLRKLTREIWL